MANHRNEKNEMMDSRNEKEKNEMNKNWFERAHNASLQLATILAILLCYCCWFFVLCVSVGHAVWLLRIIGHYLTHRFCHFFFLIRISAITNILECCGCWPDVMQDTLFVLHLNVTPIVFLRGQWTWAPSIDLRSFISSKTSWPNKHCNVFLFFNFELFSWDSRIMTIIGENYEDIVARQSRNAALLSWHDSEISKVMPNFSTNQTNMLSSCSEDRRKWKKHKILRIVKSIRQHMPWLMHAYGQSRHNTPFFRLRLRKFECEMCLLRVSVFLVGAPIFLCVAGTTSGALIVVSKFKCVHMLHEKVCTQHRRHHRWHCLFTHKHSTHIQLQ